MHPTIERSLTNIDVGLIILLPISFVLIQHRIMCIYFNRNITAFYRKTVMSDSKSQQTYLKWCKHVNKYNSQMGEPFLKSFNEIVMSLYCYKEV